MFLRYASLFDGQPQIAEVKGRAVRIGSALDNDIVISGPFVDKYAVVLSVKDKQWSLLACGGNGCETNGKVLRLDDTAEFSVPGSFRIFPFTFHAEESQPIRSPEQSVISQQAQTLVRDVHVELLNQLDSDVSTQRVPNCLESLLKVERLIEAIAKKVGMVEGKWKHVQSYLAGACVREELLRKVIDGSRKESSIGEIRDQDIWMQFATAIPQREEELRRIAATCGRLLVGDSNTNSRGRIAKIEKEFWFHWEKLVPRVLDDILLYLSLRQLKKQVKDILYGFGPLEDLLRMPTVSEIMVNSSEEIFIEKDGMIQSSGRRFISEEITAAIIERIVATVGRRIDTAQPMVDARLRDGSRVNAVIRPLASKGPCLTIRRFNRRDYSLADLVTSKSMSRSVAEFLSASVRAKKSILVSGGTGTGKTTLLNCLGLEIPMTERVISIEDTRELQLGHPNVVYLEARECNSEGTGRVAIRDLLRNSLRMRPDRIIVGECRAAEALDMLQAMNTGHDGSMTTIHANNPRDAMARLEVLVRESGLPPDAIRRQIASAFDVVVQLERLSNGMRVVSQVAEVLKQVSPATNQVRVRPLFAREFGNDSPLLPTGSLPTFAAALIKEGYLDPNVFFEDFSENDAKESSSAEGISLTLARYNVTNSEEITV